MKPSDARRYKARKRLSFWARILIGLVALVMGFIFLMSTSCTITTITKPSPVLHYNLPDGIGSWTEAELEKVLAASKPGDTVTIICSTDGGNAFSAIAMGELIDEYAVDRHIVTVARGYVYSAGFYLWLKGEERIAGDNVLFMAHGAQLAWHIVKHFPEWKQAIYRSNNRHLNKIMYSLFAERSNKSFEWWEQKLGYCYEPNNVQRTFFFNRDKAVELGLVAGDR